MVFDKGDKEESGFEDNGSATNNSDDEEDQLVQGYFYEKGCSFDLRNTSQRGQLRNFDVSNEATLSVDTMLRKYQEIYEKWYFVTKIVLTYCEKKLF